ncbi:MAG: hypothetical protein AB3N23_19785 [Paracoccaceae bacterium]
MAHKNKVFQSVNAPGDLVCVDLFQRPDGSFGFEEYRRDPEDGSGWRAIGYHGDQVFQSQDDTRAAACRAVRWLVDAM